MYQMNIKYIPFQISKTDIFIHFILFVSLDILPLFPNYTWLSTMILLPLMAILLPFKDGFYKLYADLFVKRIFIIFLFAVLSIVFAANMQYYFREIKGFLGIIVIFIIGVSMLKRNINNIWILYVILMFKFIIMVYYTYKTGVISSFNPDFGRLQSGAEVGINANAYGYFTFVALYAIGAIMIINNKQIYKFLFLTIFLIGAYINILAASRAGFLFTILSTVSIYIASSFKNWKGLYYKILVVIIILSFFLVKESSIFEKLIIFQRYTSFAESGQDQRLVILKNGLTLIGKYPFGIGAGQFEPLMVNFSNLGIIAAAHNSFILVGANYGIIALIVFLAVFHFFIKNSIKNIKSKNMLIRRYGIMFFTFGILFFFYNFFYNMILNLYIMLMFLLVNLHQNLLIKGIIPSISKNK